MGVVTGTAEYSYMYLHSRSARGYREKPSSGWGS